MIKKNGKEIKKSKEKGTREELDISDLNQSLTGLKHGILVGGIAIKQGYLNNQDILIKMQQTGGMND